MEQNSAASTKLPDKKPKLSLKLVVTIGVTALLLAILLWYLHNHNDNSVNNTNSVAAVNRRDQQHGDINIKLNQTATLGGIKLKVTKTALSISSIPGGPMINGEPQQTQFLIADITLEGTTKSAANYSYAQFSALNDSKTEAALAPSNLPLGINNPLGSGSLSSGKKVSAQVAMVLPDKFKYYYVVFTPMQGVQKRIVIQP